jgi:signal peptidase II
MAHTANIPGKDPPRPIYKDWTVLQLAALVFLLDQFSKYLVRQLLPFGWSFPTEGFFRFTHVHNTGSAFGIFQGQNTPLIFISFLGVIILVLIYRSQPYPNNWLRLSLGLQLGGAFGNLVDRLRLGFVTDFIDVGPWPVFNLADASIVTGLVLLAWIFLRTGRKDAPQPAGGTVREAAQQDSYLWCPVCDGEMVVVPGGWHCTTCGVKERIELSGLVTQRHDGPSAGPARWDGPSTDGLPPYSINRDQRDGVGRVAGTGGLGAPMTGLSGDNPADQPQPLLRPGEEGRSSSDSPNR